MKKYPLQLNDEYIANYKFKTIEEAKKFLKDYEESGWKGYEVVKLVRSGAVCAVIC